MEYPRRSERMHRPPQRLSYDGLGRQSTSGRPAIRHSRESRMAELKDEIEELERQFETAPARESDQEEYQLSAHSRHMANTDPSRLEQWEEPMFTSSPAPGDCRTSRVCEGPRHSSPLVDAHRGQLGRERERSTAQHISFQIHMEQERKRLLEMELELEERRLAVEERELQELLRKRQAERELERLSGTCSTLTPTYMYAPRGPPPKFEGRLHGEAPGRSPSTDRRRVPPCAPTDSYRDQYFTVSNQPTASGACDHDHEALGRNPAPVQVTIAEAPKLEILEFDGNPERYPFFKTQIEDARRSGVHSDSKILSHLKAKLKGKAFQAVSASLLMGGSLDDLLDVIQRRFGNPRIVVRTVTESLLGRQRIKPHDVSGLADFSIEVDSARSVLKAMGHEHELDNLRSLSQLVSKLPPSDIERWGEHGRRLEREGRIISFEVFALFLSNLVDDRQFAVPETHYHAGRADFKSGNYRGREGRVMYANTSEESSASATGQKRAELKCFYCEEPHVVRKCPKFLALTVSERVRWVQQSKACPWCLSTKHQLEDCKRKRRCGKDGCEERHDVLCHTTLARREATALTTVGAAGRSQVLMKTTRVLVEGPAGTLSCLALLDEGSSVTLMDREVAQKLGCSGESAPLAIRTIDGITSKTSENVNLTVSRPGSRQKYPLRNVHAVDDFNVGLIPRYRQQVLARYPDLSEYHLALDGGRPQLLIGIDNAGLIAAREVRHLSKNGPYLQRTLLGWSLTGRVVVGDSSSVESVNFLSTPFNQTELSDLIQTSWLTESFGCKYDLSVPTSMEDRKSEEVLRRQVTHDGTRWVAPILRRNEDQAFPPSLDMARKRMISFERRLDRKEREGSNFAKMCYDKMEKMLRNGHFRELSVEEASARPVNTWYLPLLAVTNPNKPGKVRLVLDAAAKSCGKSLNDFLMKGPDLFNSIPDILLRWREKKYALTSDVEAMFSQVLVREEDKPSLRFLWRGRKRSGKFNEYESPVVIFGGKSSPCVAEYCYRKTVEHFAPDNHSVMDAAMEDTYVDDVITGRDDLPEAVRLAEDLTCTLKRGGFNLGPWSSNSSDLLTALQPNTQVCAQKEVHLDPATDQEQARLERALGVVWNPTEDVLMYKGKHVEGPSTKRIILSTVMTVFDPFGFLASWLLRPKIIMQELWRRGLGWDDDVPEDLLAQWSRWVSELAVVSRLQVPRHLFDGTVVKSVGVHVFCDACQDAFAAAVYFRWIDEDQKVHVRLALARSRVAPLKSLSIPRLELQAAVLGVRLLNAVKKSSRKDIESVTCWTDSQNVLTWVQSMDARYDVFVSNRISEVRDSTSPQEWRHVPTSLNVADAASRGQTLSELEQSKEWFKGPSFLQSDEEFWPPSETRSEGCYVSTSAKDQADAGADILDAMPDASRFSKWSVAIRTVANVRRWLLKLRDGLKGEYSVEELRTAEDLWIKTAQAYVYSTELKDLKGRGRVSKASHIYRLNPVLVNGMICVDSRLQRSNEVDGFAKFPPILPKKHPYTLLLVRHIHANMGHRAHEAVMVELRQRCWIPQARQVIRGVAARCNTCKINRGKPHSAQMATLPKVRVNLLGGAFMGTGVDYFGPMQSSRGRSTVKLWGVIFRCLSTKAVHLELTDTLDTDGALLAISRFIARRGKPKVIWSDNGTNLRAADKEMRVCLQSLNQDLIMSKMSLEGIQWRFNPPADPEAGGVWERNVRTVKDTLRVLLKEQRPRYETLLTLLCEVERILNSTPLVHVPTDPTDEDILTPYHFLIGRASPAYPPGIFEDISLRKRWRYAQTLADHFWKRWVKEYLPTLALRTKWQGAERKPLREGDLVIVSDERYPRGLWLRGRVTEVLLSGDGQVRSAMVRTKFGELRRSLRRLIVLDVQES